MHLIFQIDVVHIPIIIIQQFTFDMHYVLVNNNAYYYVIIYMIPS